MLVQYIASENVAQYSRLLRLFFSQLVDHWDQEDLNCFC